MRNATAVSAGYGFSQAISSGQMFSWGWNEDHQLGDGTNVDKGRPVMIPGLSQVTATTAGEYHSLAMSNGAEPAPSLQAIAGQHSLEVRWRPGEGSARWTPALRPVTTPVSEWTEVLLLPATSGSRTFGGLIAERYEILLRRQGFGVASTTSTPLP